MFKLVMGSDQNLHESSVNMNSSFTICGNRKICEWHFSLFFVILSEDLANIGVSSFEIAKITGIWHARDFTF